MDIPQKSRDEAYIFNVFNSVIPGQVVAVHPVRNAHKLLTLKNRYIAAVNKHQQAQLSPFASTALKQSTEGNVPAGADEPTSRQTHSAIYCDDDVGLETFGNLELVAGNAEQYSTTFQIPSPSFCALTGTDSDDIGQYNRQVKNARDLFEEVEKEVDNVAPITLATFVVFRTKGTAACATSVPIFPSTGQFKVSRAPDPRAINWNRINISRYTARLREYISFFVLTAMTLLWTLPSSFIQALGNLSVLGDSLDNRGAGFLKRFVENNRGFARFLEGVCSPVLLFLVLLLVPLLMRFVISFERIPSRVHVENKVRNFLFLFYAMSNFFYQVGFGTFFDRLEDIVTGPREIISTLSLSVPGQGSFLMKYVLINSFVGSVIGILNMGRLLFRPLLIWKAKTARDRIGADRLFADYPFAKMYALCMMMALISYMYSTIALIINAVAFLYFTLVYLCSKQVLLFSHRPMFEGGGYLFRDAWTGLLIGLYVHQLSMIGIFLSKKATIQVMLMTVSLAFSVWFTIICRNQFSSRAENGSLLQQSPKDEEEGLFGLGDEIPKRIINMYIHPGLNPVEILKSTTMDAATSCLIRRSNRRCAGRPPSIMLDSFCVMNLL